MSLLAKLRAVMTAGQGVTRGLPELTAADDPIAFLRSWLEQARRAGILLPEAMALASSTPDGHPSVRMMLLKGIGDRGLVFFTNYESRKAGDLVDNPHAALVIHWPILERQVRAEGTVERISEEESAAYFQTRARGSQIGAWASKQSSELDSRGTLEQRVKDLEQRYPGNDIPLPPFWGGFRMSPTHIEFWQGRLNRLHDRLRYERTADGWRVVRLYP